MSHPDYKVIPNIIDFEIYLSSMNKAFNDFKENNPNYEINKPILLFITDINKIELKATPYSPHQL